MRYDFEADFSGIVTEISGDSVNERSPKMNTVIDLFFEFVDPLDDNFQVSARFQSLGGELAPRPAKVCFFQSVRSRSRLDDLVPHRVGLNPSSPSSPISTIWIFSAAPSHHLTLMIRT